MGARDRGSEGAWRRERDEKAERERSGRELEKWGRAIGVD